MKEPIPTMKPTAEELERNRAGKTENPAVPATAVTAAPTAENPANPIISGEPIDFSKVEIEPLFADSVDFDTFCKSDFRAVKVKKCEAVKKSKNS